MATEKSHTERIGEILKFHVPKKLEGTTERTICGACEVNYWPCTTYKLATGSETLDSLGYPSGIIGVSNEPFFNPNSAGS